MTASACEPRHHSFSPLNMVATSHASVRSARSWGDLALRPSADATSNLLMLPCSLLECLMELVDGDGPVVQGAAPCSVRISCSQLRDSFDSSNSRLTLGGKTLVWDEQGSPATHAPRCGWIPLLRRMPRLTSLHIQPWIQISWADALRAAGTGLLQLTLCARAEVLDLSPLAAACPKLQQLDIAGCAGVTSLAPLSTCTGLRQLNVRGLDLSDWSSLAPLTSLTHLTLSNCPNIRNLTAVSGLRQLVHLDASACLRLDKLAGLSACTQLRHLNISSCHHITDLAPLSACAALTHLDMWQCSGVADLAPLSQCTRLTCLVASGCCRVQDLAALQPNTLLQHLGLNELNNITTLQPLASLAQLRYLEMSSCWGITSLQPLAACSKLQHLNISRSRALSTQPLAALTALCIVR